MAQKDVVRSKLSLSNSEADKLIKEQSKNKLLSLCLGNGRKFKYNAPVSSQEDVNKLYSQIHKHSEQDQLAVMRQEIKFKKVVFSEFPNDLFCLSNTTLVLSRCTKIFLHCIPLMQHTWRLSLLRIFLQSLT